jgi:hypothetical protein
MFERITDYVTGDDEGPWDEDSIVVKNEQDGVMTVITMGDSNISSSARYIYERGSPEAIQFELKNMDIESDKYNDYQSMIMALDILYLHELTHWAEWEDSGFTKDPAHSQRWQNFFLNNVIQKT